MPAFKRILGVVIACTLLTACAFPRGAALQSEILAEAGAEDPTFQVVAVTRDELTNVAAWPKTGEQTEFSWLPTARGAGAPTIAVGDVVAITVWDSQENSLLTADAEKKVTINGLRVSPSGTIFVPYIDEVTVLGRTPEQARAEVQARMEPIVPSAQVVLTVTPGSGNTVDLVSGVARPGRYPLADRDYSILSLLAEGGGISPTLVNPVVRLQRLGRSYAIPSEDLFRESSRNVTLRGGDRVLVEADKRYFVALGATGSEKLVEFTKREVSALDALALIGGLSDSRADLKGVMILREYPASAVRSDGRGPAMTQVIFTLDLTSAEGLFAARRFQINPEDVVLATESPVPAIHTVVGVFRSVTALTN